MKYKKYYLSRLMIGQIGQGIDDTQRFNRFQIRRLFNFRSREVSHFMHTQF
jgi:hypothetical protein